MEPTIIYRCTGTCGGATTEAGLNCSLEGCEKIGEPLTAVHQCGTCAEAAAIDSQPHACDGCEVAA